MSGVATPQPSPNDNWANYNEKFVSSSKVNTNHKNLFPIDETEDFQDPFSDLSLFLSQKVKEEIKKRGGVKKWNHQIQTELLKSILPEFKVKFPRYRLGISALRKTWEKLSFYQQKIANVKQAFLGNGKLNIEYLIKENIRSFQRNAASYEFHPYNHAQNLAANLSECIAALDGEMPKIQQLTKMIWAVQKHLLKNSIPKASSPFEEHEPLDKLIVKTMLSAIAGDPLQPQKKLAHTVRSKISVLLNLPFLANLEELSSFLSMMIAKKIMAGKKILKELSQDQWQQLQHFLLNHIKRSTPSKFSHQKPNRLAFVQKILALYPLAPLLPRNVDKETLMSSVSLIHQEKSHSFLVSHPTFDSTLYAFIKTEILLLKEKKGAYTLEKIQQAVLEAYEEIIDTPPLDEKQIDQLEIYLWSLIDHIDQNTDTLLTHGFSEVMEEVENTIIDMPHLTFRGLIQSMTQKFKFIQKMKENNHRLEEKIQYWTLQNDMVCRFLHFDGENPFLQIIEMCCRGKNIQNHKKIIDEILAKVLQEKPQLQACRKQLQERLWILYKYYWYHERHKDKSSFESFLLWHICDLNGLSKTDLQKALIKRLQDLLPLTPFTQQQLDEVIEKK